MQPDVRQTAQHKVNKVQSSFVFTTICSLSCLFPAFLGFKKRKQINQKHSTFLIYVYIACAVELISRILVITHQAESAIILNNFYVLFEGLVFSINFYKWDIIGNRNILISIIILLTLIWFVDNFLLNSITCINSLYRVIYSISFVLIATKQFQKVYLNTPKHAIKEPIIIITVTIITNFTYRAVFESLYLFKLGFSNKFYFSAFFILIIVNTFLNCAFTYAIYCMSLRKRLTSFY
jgi:hypothetical protein